MDLLELQQRANQLVAKVNNYEASLDKYEISETDILAEHKYADLYTLRAVMNLLFGSTVDQKCDRSLNIPTDLRLFASTVPMWNTTFNLIPKATSTSDYNPILTVVGSPTNNNGIVSGLTGSTNYLYISSDNYPSSDFKEVVLVFTTSNTTTQSNDIWIDDHTCMYLSKNDNTLFAWNTISSTFTSILNVTSNTEYYIKIVKNEISSTQYRIDYYQSTDQGVSWTSIISITQNKNDNIGNVGVFGGTDGNAQFQGQADLNKSYYKLDNDDAEYYLYEHSVTGYSYEVNSDKHEFISNIDTLNNFNLIQLDALTNTVTSRDQRVQCGINYSYSSNIADALVTECQVANMFKWNTTDPDDIPNNTRTLNRQVPGVVLYYLGPEYFEKYLPTISYNPTQSKFNAVSYNNPPYWGSFYDLTRLTELDKPAMYSQWNSDMLNMWGDTATCKMFMPGMFYARGKLISPQQIWQPATKYGEENRNFGYNCQGSALYHELVFKNRRKGLDTVVKTEEVFDKSKFNIVGSPTITDDGIASGFIFSNNVRNYINLGKYNIQNELHIKVNSNNVNLVHVTRGAIYSWYVNEQNYFRLFWYTNKRLRFDYFKQGETSVIANYFDYDANGNYIFDIIYKNNQLLLLKDGEAIHTYNGAINLTALNIVNGQLGVQQAGNWCLENGSSDLKQFSITVDGEVVLKGTKEVLVEVQPDFVPTLSNVSDNDPQGLATRAVLAQQKEFYTGRLWFNELDSLNGADMTKFATAINQASRVRESSGDVDPNKFRLINDVSLLPTGVVSNYNTDKYLYADIDVLNTNQNIEVSLPLINYNESASTGIWYGFYEAGTAGNPRYRIYISSVASTTNMFQYTIDYINESGSITTTTGTIDETATNPVTTSDTLDFKMTINRQILNFYINGNKVGEDITLNANTNIAPSFMIGRVESSNNSINIEPLRILSNGIEVFTSHAVSETYMTDTEFYNKFKLNYDTYADGLNQPK